LTGSGAGERHAAAIGLIDSWMEDYNTVHPHSRLGYRSPGEYIMCFNPPPVRFNRLLKKSFASTGKDGVVALSKDSSTSILPSFSTSAYPSPEISSVGRRPSATGRSAGILPGRSR
jgi:integrase-like protein